MEHGRSPAQLITESAGLLLDFDGPVCDVYAGSSPERIATEVSTIFGLEIDTDDPLDLIAHALTTGGPVDDIHQALTDTELEAVRSATETPGIRHLVESYQGPIAIVSNNAGEAIEAWLTAAKLRAFVQVVTGRDPRRMKPDPWSLMTSAEAIGCEPDQCVFVGDSLTDAQAAAQAGVPIVALANRRQKRQMFAAEGCMMIVASIQELIVGSGCDCQ